MANKNTVIPAGFVITKCPPGEANAKSLRQLRKEEETALEMGYAGRVDRHRSLAGESRSERYMEAVRDARASGLSTSDALDAGRDAE